MAFYPTSDKLIDLLRILFARVQAGSPEAFQGVLKDKLVVRFRLAAPAAEILVNGRQKPVQVTFETGAARPDLDIELAADTLHQLLLDQLSTKKAMGAGQIKVKGPPWKLPVLIDIIKSGRLYYRDILKEKGFS